MGAVVPSGPRHDVDARGARHPPVDHRHVVLVELELVDRVVAALHGVDLVALVLEAQHEDVAQAGVVLGHEDAHQSVPPPIAIERIIPAVRPEP